MRFKSLLIIIAVILLSASSVTAQDYTLQSLNDKYKALNDDTQIMQLCREYMSKASDINVIRDAQDKFSGINPDSALVFSKKLYDEHPDSAKYAYLYGRLVEGSVEKIDLGKKVVALAPKWPFGYRLVAATYVQSLLGAQKKDPAEDKLKKNLPGDLHYIKDLVKLDSNQVYPYQFVLAYYLYNKSYDSALQTLQRASELKLAWPSPIDYASLYAAMGRYPDAQKAVEAYIDMGISQGQMDPQEKDSYIDQIYTSALQGVHAYKEALDFKLARTASPDSSASYDIACLYALSGDKEKAFEYLTRAGDLKWSEIEQVKGDSDLVSLHSDPRWAKILAVFEANYDAGIGGRKAAALAMITDQEAPLWTLIDDNGNAVSLADLKGKVVVLDFWATWCVYCKMAMPLIDEFTKEKAADNNVRVFAVDVFEKGQNKVHNFYREKGYNMTLLYGNDELPRAYGFRGIPYICVIDKNGRIRYIESGYSPDLKEKLTWWTEDLLKL
ncbi:exported hypothetical protein [Candidatus Zixiibacteriota bacterium]|nr:exported hypothetical protein [candidate division Zixibacteria bacterium]